MLCFSPYAGPFSPCVDIFATFFSMWGALIFVFMGGGGIFWIRLDWILTVLSYSLKCKNNSTVAMHLLGDWGYTLMQYKTCQHRTNSHQFKLTHVDLLLTISVDCFSSRIPHSASLLYSSSK